MHLCNSLMQYLHTENVKVLVLLLTITTRRIIVKLTLASIILMYKNIVPFLGYSRRIRGHYMFSNEKFSI